MQFNHTFCWSYFIRNLIGTGHSIIYSNIYLIKSDICNRNKGVRIPIGTNSVVDTLVIDLSIQVIFAMIILCILHYCIPFWHVFNIHPIHHTSGILDQTPFVAKLPLRYGFYFHQNCTVFFVTLVFVTFGFLTHTMYGNICFTSTDSGIRTRFQTNNGYQTNACHMM